MSEAPRDSLTSWRKNLRTFPCFNTTTETIPPYAIMQLRKPAAFKEDKGFANTVEKDEFAVQHLSGGRTIWDVTKPNEEGENRQCAEDFVFNGPVPIEPQQPGVCTQDYPCQVLHNGDNDQLLNGQPCGPVADRWYIQSGGAAFACKSHDLGYAAGRGLIHTVWVDRTNQVSVAVRGRCNVLGSTAAAASMLTLQIAAGAANGAYHRGIEVEDGGEWLRVARSGLFLVSFSGKLTSTVETLGNELAIRLYVKRDGTGAITPYVASRDMAIVSGVRLGGNVAFCGFETLEAGESIGLKNESGTEISLYNGVLTLARIGNSLIEEVSSSTSFDTTQS